MRQLCSLAVLFVFAMPVSSQDMPDYRSRTIYFLLTDRFHPHQPYNPYVDPRFPDATNSVDCFSNSCNTDEEFRKYWVGISKDSRKSSTMSSISVPQPFGSRRWLRTFLCMKAAQGYGTGYHGYWVQNYYQVNQHFGDWADVDDLSDNLHARGMPYMQDITLNDSNPNGNHVYGRVYNGDSIIFVRSFKNDFDHVYGSRFYKHYEKTPQCQRAATLTDTEWTWWKLHHCPLADLSGWNQHDPLTAQYLTNAGEARIDHGVDDFRLDAIKFVFPDFISSFTHAMIDHLQDLGRPDPYIVGEFSGGGVAIQSPWFSPTTPLLQDILDFQLSFELNRFIGGSYEVGSEQADAGALDRLLRQRVIAFQGRDDWMGTFLDNHDEIRTMTRLKVLNVPTEAERRQRMDLGTVLLMTVRGIPIIYYGDE